LSGWLLLLVNVVLEVLLDDELELGDYEVNFRRMFGDTRMDAVVGSVEGSMRFFELTPTSIKLEGLDRHQRLIDSNTVSCMGRGRGYGYPSKSAQRRGSH
jgi:ribosomal protein S12 methylthiotransferase accessory factor